MLHDAWIIQLSLIHIALAQYESEARNCLGVSSNYLGFLSAGLLFSSHIALFQNYIHFILFNIYLILLTIYLFIIYLILPPVSPNSMASLKAVLFPSRAPVG